MAYLLDTNVFIQAKNLHYSFDFCPAFWDWLDAAHAAGSVYSIEKVGDELQGQEDDLADWASARRGMFLAPDTAVVPSLRAVSRWAGSGAFTAAAVSTFLQVADYYLVAHAHAHQHVVVTHERVSDGIRRIKIPNACIELGVKCMTPYEMLRLERARFVLG
ncbi:MAG TPA: DUF4411 family protein [Streptosporangiaceae bacterium]|jgi:hypothetical protein